MGVADDIRTKRGEILKIATGFGARNVRVFGSAARGDAGPGSDVDLLVDFEAGRSLMDHAGLLVALEDLLGRKVDVVPERTLRPHLRERVLREALPI
jgi:predicted nucleotidyltransferase